jgi:hypothetical protein
MVEDGLRVVAAMVWLIVDVDVGCWMLDVGCWLIVLMACFEYGFWFHIGM